MPITEHGLAQVELSSWGVRAQFREQGQHGDFRGHAASDVAFSQVPERRIRHKPAPHCTARTARAYKTPSLVSDVMPAGKVAAANGLLPSDLIGRPPMIGRPLSARASSEACTKVHAHAHAGHTHSRADCGKRRAGHMRDVQSLERGQRGDSRRHAAGKAVGRHRPVSPRSGRAGAEYSSASTSPSGLSTL
jgi:hypothetical protein